MRMKSSRVSDDIGNALREHGLSGATIVYVNTVKETEAVAQAINAMGIQTSAGRPLRAEPYHGQLNIEQRSLTHHRFRDDETNVVVATTGAFE